MIGNDIVDLAQAKQESNWQRKGFLEKLFTDEEQQYIYASPNPERMVWMLWSMKESAYKASFRETRNRTFAPQKIACQLTYLTDRSAEGIVSSEKIYRTKTILTPNYIATTATLTTISSDFEPVIFSFTDTAYTTQSLIVRTKIVQHCANLLSIPNYLIAIQKDQNGIPSLHINEDDENPLQIAISISHHGYYGAYVIALPIQDAN